mgnify:CR=1 FL=1
MPRSEAHLDAPIGLRRVRHAEAFTDSLAGVPFVSGVAQSGMPPSVLSRLVGLGLPLLDLGLWDAPAPAPSAVLPPEPATPDAPAVSPAHAAPLASSPSRHHNSRTR